MKRYLLPSALILALGLSFALAQNITKSLQQSQSPGAFGVDSSLNVYFPAHILTVGKTPSINVGTVAGSDFSGTVTESTNSIGWVLTFATAYLASPHCSVTAESPGAALATPIAYSTVTTALTVTHLSQVSQKLDYFCSGAS